MTRERQPPRQPRPVGGEGVPVPTDRTRELLDHLDAQVAAIHDSDTFRRFLDVQARFHTYSWGNVGLILAQWPDATRVAGYRTWQSVGRQVTRGEKAIRILVPVRRKGDDEEAGEEERRLLFGVGTVFDISQTDGDPLPRVEVPILEGDAGGHLYEALATAARNEGIAVARHGSLGTGMTEAMGIYRPGPQPRIVVREAPQLQMTKTRAHELAHHFTGRHETYDARRAAYETIAEATAYVVLAHFGLDSGARSLPYVATWATERAVVREVLGTIQGVANTLIKRVETQYGLPVVQTEGGA